MSQIVNRLIRGPRNGLFLDPIEFVIARLRRRCEILLDREALEPCSAVMTSIMAVRVTGVILEWREERRSSGVSLAEITPCSCRRQDVLRPSGDAYVARNRSRKNARCSLPSSP